ncbi:dihydroxyacetone kinase family protein [Humibacter ginsengiterrae]
MSHVVNDPAEFAEEALRGFVAANRSLIARVPGGVSRRSGPAPGVAVVIGGGSGHYPAFAGFVGAGLAHAAALGNVFASPSAEQVYEVARSVAGPAGVLLSYGNYAGDVLNFDEAQRRLLAEGVPCATVRVTDDIFSGGAHDREKRRGIAGDLAVFKAAAWAAEQGLSLDETAALAARANDRTRTIGVAFSGCTLPGADEPLFTIAPGHMAVGMGIHGEPGIETLPLPDAGRLAELLVSRLLAERPMDGADRVAVIVNGLGSVKSEELFLLYGMIEDHLERAGLTVVEPEVGEFATSFEMAGVSLTLMWLDDELEAAWNGPAYAPGYRKGTVTPVAKEPASEASASADAPALPESSAESRRVAACVCEALTAIRDVIDREADELGRLDAVAGDGDHGIGMQRGARAAVGAAMETREAGGGAGTVLVCAGNAWANRAGGTSGALWGAALRAAGERIGDTDAPLTRTIAEAVQEARREVQTIGKATVGDKTLVDALVPFASTLTDRARLGDDLPEAWAAAAQAASDAADATAKLVPRLGRARPHAENSVGTPDPGAVSFALAMAAVAELIGAADAPVPDESAQPTTLAVPLEDSADGGAGPTETNEG